jgi:uncharacterized membrane protein YgdD (TMEM256/DUF423 family)
MRRVCFLLATIAALQGAAGVALAAAAAHAAAAQGSGGANLATASQFLMIHAAAGLGLAAFAQGLATPSRWFAGGAFLLQAGVTLFSGDLVARVYAEKLFPMAAPIGGSATICAWLVLFAFFATQFIGLSKRGGA